MTFLRQDYMIVKVPVRFCKPGWEVRDPDRPEHTYHLFQSLSCNIPPTHGGDVIFLAEPESGMVGVRWFNGPMYLKTFRPNVMVEVVRLPFAEVTDLVKRMEADWETAQAGERARRDALVKEYTAAKPR